MSRKNVWFELGMPIIANQTPKPKNNDILAYSISFEQSGGFDDKKYVYITAGRQTYMEEDDFYLPIGKFFSFNISLDSYGICEMNKYNGPQNPQTSEPILNNFVNNGKIYNYKEDNTDNNLTNYSLINNSNFNYSGGELILMYIGEGLDISIYKKFSKFLDDINKNQQSSSYKLLIQYLNGDFGVPNSYMLIVVDNKSGNFVLENKFINKNLLNGQYDPNIEDHNLKTLENLRKGIYNDKTNFSLKDLNGSN